MMTVRKSTVTSVVASQGDKGGEVWLSHNEENRAARLACSGAAHYSAAEVPAQPLPDSDRLALGEFAEISRHNPRSCWQAEAIYR